MRKTAFAFLFAVSVGAMSITGFASPAEARTKTSSGYFEPKEVANTFDLASGDVIVDTAGKRLIFAYDDEIALIYPVAVGREGSAWRGEAEVRRVVMGPSWYPTADQRSKRKLPTMVGPGPNNPLGKYAFYLFQGDHDTLIRIHGTNAPDSIGKAVSDGCIRMRNEHIAQLYDLIEVGANVTVK